MPSFTVWWPSAPHTCMAIETPESGNCCRARYLIEFALQKRHQKAQNAGPQRPCFPCSQGVPRRRTPFPPCQLGLSEKPARRLCQTQNQKCNRHAQEKAADEMCKVAMRPQVKNNAERQG